MTLLRTLAPALAVAMAIALPIPAASSEADPLQAAVTALGNINGRALACGHSEVVSRAKAIVIARVAKTRELGEVFEKATSAAFLAQVQRKAECPSRAALTVELEVAARPFNPPNAHQLSATPDTPEVGINPRYLLQAANGRAVMDGDFKDRFQLITFGYTFCPDICPTSLGFTTQALSALAPEELKKVQMLFVTVDPERDTLDKLKAYTAYFHPSVLGLTGSPEEIAKVARLYGAMYARQNTGSAGGYVVDHSAYTYVIAPDGSLFKALDHGTPPAQVLEAIRAVMK